MTRRREWTDELEARSRALLTADEPEPEKPAVMFKLRANRAVPTGLDPGRDTVDVRIFAGPGPGRLQLAGQVVLRADEWHWFAAALLAGSATTAGLEVEVEGDMLAPRSKAEPE